MRIIALVILLILPGLASAAPWYLDQSGSRISVKVGYLGNSSVNVRFQSFGGTIDFDEKRPQNTKAAIRVNSSDIETGLGLVNRLVRSPDYLDAKGHPEITFKLDKLVQTSSSTADILGRITLRGVERPIQFDAKVFRYGPSDANPDVFEAGFDLSGQIDRRDFGSTAGIPEVATNLPITIRLLMTSKPV